MPPNPLEGFTFDPMPKAQPSALEGFVFDPTPAQDSNLTWTGHPAPTTMGEGVQQIGRDIKKAGEVAADVYRRANEQAKGLLTGTVEPTPENVMPAVLATINPAQRGTAAAIASVVGRRGAAPAAQTAEAALPGYVGSPIKQAVAERLAGVPFVGKPVREAAAKPLAEFEGRVASADEAILEHVGRAEAAATRPTGAIPDQTRAGKILSQGAKEEEQFRTLEDPLAVRLRMIRDGKPENAVNHIISMGGTGKNADPATLASLRKNINSTDWREIEGATFARLGQVTEYGPSGAVAKTTFDPMIGLDRYANELSEAGRRIIFGKPNAPFRTHIESLIADKKSLDALSAKLQTENARLDPLRRIPTGPTTGGIAEAAAVGTSALIHPLVALSAVVGGRVAASMLSRPQTAAALAIWSKAYVRFLQSGGGPGAMTMLKTATSNLSNTSNVDIDPDKLVEAMRGRVNAPPTAQRVDENSFRFGDKPEIGGIVRETMRLAPRGLPMDSYRRSQNVEDRTGETPRINPPQVWNNPADAMEWSMKQPDLRAYMQNAANEYAWNYVPNLPRGPLGRAAGLTDLEVPGYMERLKQERLRQERNR